MSRFAGFELGVVLGQLEAAKHRLERVVGHVGLAFVVRVVVCVGFVDEFGELARELAHHAVQRAHPPARLFLARHHNDVVFVERQLTRPLGFVVVQADHCLAHQARCFRLSFNPPQSRFQSHTEKKNSKKTSNNRHYLCSFR